MSAERASVLSEQAPREKVILGVPTLSLAFQAQQNQVILSQPITSKITNPLFNGSKTHRIKPQNNANTVIIRKKSISSSATCIDNIQTNQVKSTHQTEILNPSQPAHQTNPVNLSVIQNDENELKEKISLNIEAVNQTLALKDYTLIGLIGFGAYATVYKVHNSKYNQEFAIKIFPRSQNSTAFLNEIQNLKRLNHPNIIRIYDYFEDLIYSYMVLEYCPNGTLMDKINEKKILQYNEISEILVPVLSALNFCHSKGIAHSDIKPENILFDAYNRVKLADFGLSICQEINQKTNKFNGSRPYMSPEIILKQPFNPFLADIWSIGVLVYSMATGTLPWASSINGDFDKSITMGYYSVPYFVDSRLKKIIKKALNLNPKQRISIENIQSLLMPIQNSSETKLLNIQKRKTLPSILAFQRRSYKINK